MVGLCLWNEECIVEKRMWEYLAALAFFARRILVRGGESVWQSTQVTVNNTPQVDVNKTSWEWRNVRVVGAVIKHTV
jgi:hypothetical protein